MNNTVEHQKLVDDILYYVGSTPMARVWKQVNGLFRTVHGERVVCVGVEGSADVSGILLDGRRLEIEAKTGKAVQTKEQKTYQAMIEKFGGVYILAHSWEEALTGVKKALYPKG